MKNKKNKKFVYENTNIITRVRIPENRDLIKGLRLNRNERVENFPQYLLSKIFKKIKNYELGKYPDQNLIYKHLSNYLKIKNENILLSSGIDGSLKSIFEIFLKPNDKIAYLSPSYAMYAVYSKIFKIKILPIPYDTDFNLEKKKLFECIKKGIKILFLPNPNQPIEDNLSLEDLEKLVKLCKRHKVLMVVDEAYHMYGSQTASSLIKKYENLIILRTFSKSFGLPSLRLGYILSNKNMIKILDTYRLSYESNLLVDKVAIYFLQNKKLVNNYIIKVKQGRDFIKNELKKINLRVIGGRSNYLLVIFNNDKEYNKAYKSLLTHKIYVKGGYKGILKNGILFTCGPKKFMKRLLAIIKKNI